MRDEEEMKKGVEKQTPTQQLYDRISYILYDRIHISVIYIYTSTPYAQYTSVYLSYASQWL